MKVTCLFALVLTMLIQGSAGQGLQVFLDDKCSSDEVCPGLEGCAMSEDDEEDAELSLVGGLKLVTKIALVGKSVPETEAPGGCVTGGYDMFPQGPGGEGRRRWVIWSVFVCFEYAFWFRFASREV